MTRCLHCGYENNNPSCCAGCGRGLTRPIAGPVCCGPDQAVSLVDEMRQAVERVFPSDTSSSEEPFMARPAAAGIDVSRIAAESGLFIVGEARYEPLTGKETARGFFLETAVVIVVSLLLAFISKVWGHYGVVAATKVYLVSFMALSSATWLLFPYLFGSSPLVALLFRFSLIRQERKSAQGDAAATLLLWFVSLSYSLIPLLFAEYLYLMVARDHYQPLSFQLSDIRYMRAC
ncbi:MAG TPA: hypothetical protein PKH10_03220 [bacterium]|nr:hypothetical protein [bacterium]